MGSGGSKAPVYIPANTPPPRRVEEEYPVQQPIGISKGSAEGCRSPTGGVCQLAVPQGVSSSGAKLYRDQGTIRRDQCRRYANDLKKVVNQEKSFEEVKKDLVAGLYYEELSNGYCRQIMYAPEDVKAVLSPDKLPADKVRYNSIRAMSDSGSYSSVTKLFIKPSIPFKIELNGKPHTISVMTLMHPSPIRMENVQHDAMLTLGDPGEKNNDGLVVLVPLQGSLMAGASGAFMNKVTRYMTGVLQPDPATGDYKEIDIPTGNDWDLSKLFPGTPEDGKTYVTDVGYYVWIGYPPLELVPSGSASPSTTKNWFANFFLREPGIQRYSWEPQRKAGVKYVMLSKPALVNSMDLQTIRMLPVTPVTEAVAPIATWTLSYRMAGKVGANGEWESSCPASSPRGTFTDLFSGGTREGVDETLSEQCDPFAPGAFAAPDSKDAFVKVIIAFFTACAVGVAIYLAVYFFTKTKWGQWAAHQGTLAGNYVSQAFVVDTRKRLPADKRFEVTPEMEAAEAEREKKKAEAEEARVKREEEKAKKADDEWLKKEEAKRKTDEEAEKKKAADEKVKAAEEKLRAELARAAEEKRTTASEKRRAGIAAAAAEGEAIVAAEDAAKQPPVKPDDIVVSPQLPAPGTPAANAVAAAEPPQESRADMFRRRAQEAAKKAKEDTAKKGPAVPPDVAYRSPAVAPKRKPRKPVEPSESKAEAAERVEALEAAEGKVPEEGFDMDEAVRDQAKAFADIAAMRKDTEKTDKAIREMRKAVEERDADVDKYIAEIREERKAAKARAEDAVKAADEAKIAAEELAEKPKPSGPKSFANVASANGPTIEQRAAKKEAERVAKEAAKAAAEAEAAAKAAADAEAEIKRKAEEAAKSASKVVETRAAKPASLAEPIMRKPGEPSAAFSRANPMLAKQTADPKEVKSALSTLEKTIKEVNGIAKPAQLSASQEAALTDADKAAAKKELEKLRDKVESDIKDARQREKANLDQARDGASGWRQFENEKKLQSPFFSLLARNLDKFAKAIEESKLPQSERAEFIRWLDAFKDQFLKLATAAKKRIDSFQIVTTTYVKGGRRRRMKRKSTRRYVA